MYKPLKDEEEAKLSSGLGGIKIGSADQAKGSMDVSGEGASPNTCVPEQDATMKSKENEAASNVIQESSKLLGMHNVTHSMMVAKTVDNRPPVICPFLEAEFKKAMLKDFNKKKEQHLTDQPGTSRSGFYLPSSENDNSTLEKKETKLAMNQMKPSLEGMYHKDEIPVMELKEPINHHLAGISSSGEEKNVNTETGGTGLADTGDGEKVLDKYGFQNVPAKHKLPLIDSQELFGHDASGSIMKKFPKFFGGSHFKKRRDSQKEIAGDDDDESEPKLLRKTKIDLEMMGEDGGTVPEKKIQLENLEKHETPEANLKDLVGACAVVRGEAGEISSASPPLPTYAGRGVPKPLVPDAFWKFKEDTEDAEGAEGTMSAISQWMDDAKSQDVGNLDALEDMASHSSRSGFDWLDDIDHSSSGASSHELEDERLEEYGLMYPHVRQRVLITDGSRPLHSAACVGDWLTIEMLSKRGHTGVAELLARDQYGETPLHNAARLGHTNVTRVLLDAAVREYILDDGLPQVLVRAINNYKQTPVHLAAEGGHVNTLLRLLQVSAEASGLKDENAELPLHYAARNGSIACIRILKVFGGVRYSTNLQGRTALQVAAAEGHVGAVAELLNIPGGGPPRGAVRDALNCAHPRVRYLLECAVFGIFDRHGCH